MISGIVESPGGNWPSHVIDDETAVVSRREALNHFFDSLLLLATGELLHCSEVIKEIVNLSKKNLQILFVTKKICKIQVT